MGNRKKEKEEKRYINRFYLHILPSLSYHSSLTLQGNMFLFETTISFNEMTLLKGSNEPILDRSRESIYFQELNVRPSCRLQVAMAFAERNNWKNQCSDIPYLHLWYLSKVDRDGPIRSLTSYRWPRAGSFVIKTTALLPWGLPWNVLFCLCQQFFFSFEGGAIIPLNRLACRLVLSQDTPQWDISWRQTKTREKEKKKDFHFLAQLGWCEMLLQGLPCLAMGIWQCWLIFPGIKMGSRRIKSRKPAAASNVVERDVHEKEMQ